MKTRLKQVFIGAMFVLFAAAPVMTVALPATASAKAPQTPADCENRILGMPPWFRGLVAVQKNPVTQINECIIIAPCTPSPTSTVKCTPDPENPSKTVDLAGFIWRIALNVIEIGLFIAGYAALFFILYGGFLFLTGGANPGQTEKARVTLLNAIIGFAISTAAIGAVNLIFNVIK